MALRAVGGAGRRRAPGGRSGFVALACGLYLAAGIAATWPALRQSGHRFLAEPAAGYGEAAPGDHLQAIYRLWLLGHQLERGEAPWRDPYTFRPEAAPQVSVQGWPLGLAFWPLSRLLGAVRGWNVLLLLTYAAAGGLTCAWLRELGLPRGAALVGGVAFALAPYRSAQSAGHLLGPLSALVPGALWALERARRGGLAFVVLAAALLVAIPLSGQLHLALGAIPFVAAYAAYRAADRRALLVAGVGVVAAAAVGLLVHRALVAGSIAEGGRTLAAVRFFSPDWADFFSREARHGSEKFLFLGWATPALAAVGLGYVLAARRHGLGTLLAVAVAVPVLLALGTKLPGYEVVREAVPPFRYARVPSRMLPLACLGVAALVAFAVARVRSPAATVLLAVLVALDLRWGVTVYGAVAAEDRNAAYAALAHAPPGRLLELPVFTPERHYGSVYHYYALQAPRERPAGYSTLAPVEADALARRLRRLNCGDWDSRSARVLAGLGVRWIALHRGLYEANPLVPRSCLRPAERALRLHGFRPVARDGAVTMYRRSAARTELTPST
jgi:hypothetical protein